MAFAALAGRLRALEATEFAWFKSKRVWAVLCVILVLQTAAVVLIFARERAAQRDGPAGAAKNIADLGFRPAEGGPIVLPTVAKGDEAPISPAEIVIGVEVHGKSRAYRLGALASHRSHLVNDVIDAVPVSVSYCNLTDCVSVFEGRKGAGPLDVQVAGLLNVEMILQINGHFYYQQSGAPVDASKTVPPIPLRRLAPTRTTWAEWAERHPGTDVYLGDASSRDQIPPTAQEAAVNRRAPEG